MVQGLQGVSLGGLYSIYETISEIRNKRNHQRRGRLRCLTRRLCKAEALAMNWSEHSERELRKVSLTQRERLTPERACSTRMRS